MFSRWNLESKGWGGVRIEDTVAVFDNKVDTLSSAPKSVDEVIIS